jgi:hypothetical protein
MNNGYSRLVEEAYNKVRIYTKEYEIDEEKEDSMAFVVLLMGAGVAKVSVNRDEPHNYQAVIDAIHQYYRDTNNQNIIDAYDDGIKKLIEYIGNEKGIQNTLNIINYELYKEKAHTNSFKIDCAELLTRLRNEITKDLDVYKREKPDFEEWLKERSDYIEEKYGYKL